ncbi:glycoside hydrolase family 2 protein [Flavivirga eckloniae]|uniref:Beta-galactosidase n=1 Tax=Flavivirga eckloniae TaxID=1803846 RepID=A0A2K9PN76_9FLAO|nr:sugar-binding domain-containing protein [Flavivirga eckloniae]AUP78513.1 beta-galactosidase [Flavivirga eckloniae]
MKNTLFLFLGFAINLMAQTNLHAPEFSQAGFWKIENSGRDVFNFNIGWRFLKGDANNAEKFDFDDSKWNVVNTPHGLEYVSSEASGSNNYQGPAWYRKHFTVDKSSIGKVIKIHFEGVMGKCKIWLNGEKITEHYGGYLPFEADLTDKLKADEDNVLAVWVDNSDDPMYPPGKPQTELDFSYFGGVYRDVWMVVKNKIYITNPNAVNKVAGGGVFTHVESVSETQAKVLVMVDIQNDLRKKATVTATLNLRDPNGKIVAGYDKMVSLSAGKSKQIKNTFNITKPKLWAPWSPDLYRLEVRLTNKKQDNIDGVAIRLGIRKIEFKGIDGLFLNNKPYPGKLMGANRHQDHGYVGNAIPNNGQWRDAKILKNAGCDIIRAAHYPADPAFMDACDALGLFYIVATPGWQFWNKDPIFEARVYQDIRNMVRRDRNYACVIMWEPILNETDYPERFAKTAHETVHEEYPFQGAYTVCDYFMDGQEHYDVLYAHPWQIKSETEKRSSFTREWGDNVDDFFAHNSPSRVARGWGEHAQLVQAKHYAAPDYPFTTWNSLADTPPQKVGGTLWHAFDHQRGYHPDPFYGGLTDVFRQPKYSYHMFASQRDVSEKNDPMIFIAHEMTPFSEPDVQVYTNCDEVRLIVMERDTLYQKASDLKMAMKHPIITFKKVFDFMEMKKLFRSFKIDQVSIVAEGIIDGEVVARAVKKPSKRPSGIVLSLQNDGVPFTANGSDFVRVIASVVDEDGIVKRLNNSDLKFEVRGEGGIIGDASILANPRKLEWGTAPILVRSTLKPGKVIIKASVVDEGAQTPLSGELEIESISSTDRFIYSELGVENVNSKGISSQKDSQDVLLEKIKKIERELNTYRLKEVEIQQKNFDEGKKKN